MNRRDELADRLDRASRLGSGWELDRLAEATQGESLEAVFAAIWRWKGWIGAATGEGLHLARNPRGFGRGRLRSWRWADLQTMRSGGTRSVTFEFGAERVLLRVPAEDEFLKLLAAARGPAETTTDELRALARTKLGKTLASGWAPTIDGLPDRLEADERVERLAIAKLDFDGLLVVTDRRLLLLDVGVRSERSWETRRSAIRRLALAEDSGLRLTLDGGDVTIGKILPPDRRDELAAVLDPR